MYFPSAFYWVAFICSDPLCSAIASWPPVDHNPDCFAAEFLDAAHSCQIGFAPAHLQAIDGGEEKVNSLCKLIL